MKAKKYILLAAILLSTSLIATAQTTFGGNDTEITVTDDDGDKEVIALPEGMIFDVDSLLRVYNAEQYLTPSGDCNRPDVNPETSAEEIIKRLSRLPTIIEMPYNDAVRQCIDRYSGRLRKTVSIMLGTQNFYMPIFEEALEAYGLPLELKYLPVVESSLNPNAVSRAGATGLWQFMLATGKQYGLEVNTLVDERRDPVKASYAAAHYLSDLKKVFGDWNLVIAAYNCGPENVNKAIHRSNGETDYWQIYPYLPKETRGYVPAFIAANYIMNFYCEHNICPMKAELPAKTDTVVVSRDVHLEQIAAVVDVDIALLRALNPQYRHDIVNGNTQPSAIRLPSEKINDFIDNEDRIYAYNAETLLSKRSTVAVNTAPASTAKKSKQGKSSGTKRVTVRKGDTLSKIAARNHTTVAKLRKLNGLKGNTIRPGQKLRVR